MSRAFTGSVYSSRMDWLIESPDKPTRESSAFNRRFTAKGRPPPGSPVSAGSARACSPWTLLSGRLSALTP